MIDWPLVLGVASLLALVISLVRTGRVDQPAVVPDSASLSVLARVPVPEVLVARLGALPATTAARRLLGSTNLGRARAGAAALGAAVALLVLIAVPVALPLGLLVPVAGVGVPDVLAARAEERRRRALVEQLPDALDLLAVCAHAGMSLDRALDLVAEQIGGRFGDELAVVRRQIELGSTRMAALTSLADRTAAESVEQFCASLVRAEQLGTPIADTLQRLATSMRHTRSQLARDRAAKAAPKIQLVIALLMVPATLMMVIGLLLIELVNQVDAVIGAG